MLKELRIRNLAVIESLAVTFGPGLNMLTGETGAGKSVLVDALTMLLGERAQAADVIRTGEESASLEAVFSVPAKGPIPGVLEAHGLRPEQGQLIVRRELVRGGRGRAFLNDASVTLALLTKLGEALVEVQGQHEHQGLLRPARHLDLLDAFGGLVILRERLRQRYEEWQACAAELAAVTAAGRDKEARLTEHRATVAEIDAARLRPGEDEALRDERRRLQNAERLAELAAVAHGHLYEDAGAASARTGQARAALRELVKLDPTLAPLVATLETAAAELDEAARALGRYRDGIVAEPTRLDEIERRLDEISRLKRKHGDSIEAVVSTRERLAREIEQLAQGEAQGRQLGERLDKLRPELGTRALDLSERRQQAASRLEELVAAELRELDIEKALFRVRFARERAGQDELGAGSDEWRVGARGVDQVEFLFSPNPGEEPRSLARIASGGELSRTMLALKTVLAAADGVPVLVFDEADAGIGGKTADMVGRKLRRLSRQHQVLCITHLPQIACYADHHFRVDKRVEGERTLTSVTPLRKEERVREVARMLGGETVTETSMRHAFELISQARTR